MDFNFGQDAPQDSGSGSGSNWLGLGQRSTLTSSSPGVPNTMPEGDDPSFAESFRPEASPLFNPLFMGRASAATENAPSMATSPGPAPTWPWQRDPTALDDTTFNTDTLGSPDTSALSEQHSRMFSSPEKPTPQKSVAAYKVISPERAPFSPLQESAARAQEYSIVESDVVEEASPNGGIDPRPIVEEARIEIHEHIETIIQSSEKQPEGVLSQQEHEDGTGNGETERVEETPTETPVEPATDDDDKSTDGQETPAQEQSKVLEPSSAPAAGSSSLRSALLSVGRGLMKRMSAPPPAFATPSQPDDSQFRRALSSQADQHAERAGSTPSLAVELKPMSEPEKATFSDAPTPSEEAPPANEATPASPAKRGRPKKQSLVGTSLKSATKSPRGRRSIASAPASPVVRKAPISAANRVRKSMPASVLANETPKKRGRPRKSDATATPVPPPSTAKRGRPRKSDIAATPAAPPSTAKRGRPRKSDATPIVVPSASKPLSARGRRVASASKAVVTPRKAISTQTPKTVIGLRAAPATPASTPKPRGRPPKNPPQPSPEKVEPEIEAPKRAGGATRGVDAPEDVPASKKSTRTVKPRAVSSPARKGRAARTAAVAASTPNTKTETKPATKRGRQAATEPEVDNTVETPKKRGRPAKTEAPAAEPKTRKRGRAAATEETAAEEPAPKKRGRAAKPAVEEKEPAPAPKRRGRAAASKATEATEPAPAPAKKRGAAKTAAKTNDDAATGLEAAPKKRGRPAASAKATAEVATETATKRGRAKRTAPEPEPEVEFPEPPSKKPRTTRKADESAPAKPTKTATGRKAGRPAKATKETVEEPAPKRGKATRTKAAEPAPVEEAPKPAAKPRGRAAAKKAMEPAAEAEVEKPKARGRATKAKSGKGELPSSKSADAPATKRGRPAAAKATATSAKAKGSAPTGILINVTVLVRMRRRHFDTVLQSWECHDIPFVVAPATHHFDDRLDLSADGNLVFAILIRAGILGRGGLVRDVGDAIVLRQALQELAPNGLAGIATQRLEEKMQTDSAAECSIDGVIQVGREKDDAAKVLQFAKKDANKLVANDSVPLGRHLKDTLDVGTQRSGVDAKILGLQLRHESQLARLFQKLLPITSLLFLIESLLLTLGMLALTLGFSKVLSTATPRNIDDFDFRVLVLALALSKLELIVTDYIDQDATFHIVLFDAFFSRVQGNAVVGAICQSLEVEDFSTPCHQPFFDSILIWVHFERVMPKVANWFVSGKLVNGQKLLPPDELFSIEGHDFDSNDELYKAITYVILCTLHLSYKLRVQPKAIDNRIPREESPSSSEISETLVKQIASFDLDIAEHLINSSQEKL
ncbi:hypothetical protein HG530_001101 [Fusarium avenaceum]|nr:hypothetical protein HG530_001101 [Fusarium avenaceum]